MKRLKPSVLLNHESGVKNFDHGKNLVDQAMLEVIQDFCFPNGVLAKKLDYIPGKPLFEQSEDTSETISEILFKQKTMRENMFVFSLDASDAVDRELGNENY